MKTASRDEHGQIGSSVAYPVLAPALSESDCTATDIHHLSLELPTYGYMLFQTGACQQLMHPAVTSQHTRSQRPEYCKDGRQLKPSVCYTTSGAPHLEAEEIVYCTAVRLQVDSRDLHHTT